MSYPASNCSLTAECFLSTAFDRTYSDIMDGVPLKNALSINPETFRTLGISLEAVLVVASFFVHVSKIAPVRASHTLQDRRANYWNKLCALFTPAIGGYNLFVLIPWSQFVFDNNSWILFQDQVRLIQCTKCLGNDSNNTLLPAFKPIGSALIEINNKSLNRVATVAGWSTFTLTTLIAIQLVVSCLLHKKVTKKDAVCITLIAATIAYEIFSLSKSSAIDVGPELRSNWDGCVQYYNGSLA